MDYPDRSLPEELRDCSVHGAGSGSELLIVEGMAAAHAVNQVRNRSWQAVLPLQGKPPNVLRSSERTIRDSARFQDVLAALGIGSLRAGPSHRDVYARADRARYDRVVLLFDPDVDGVHTQALTLLFFARFLRPLLEAGQVYTARAPRFGVVVTNGAPPLFAATEAQRDALAAEHAPIFAIDTYKSVASFNPPDLASLCLAPETRTLGRLTVAHAEAAERSYRAATT